MAAGGELGVDAGRELSPAVLRLEAWLETMRQAAGYGGPVVHWWRDSLLFCGPGCDWRYEGIIRGYLALFGGTGDPRWLQRAKRAGNDLLVAQLPSGSYRQSGFELNPSTAGTPHEAAADVALLALATELKLTGDAAWPSYLAAARCNLDGLYLVRLWDEDGRLFRDDPTLASGGFVPNKAATLVEALFLIADLTGEDQWLEAFARPTLAAVLRYQRRASGDPLRGAIAQNSLGASLVGRYFPFYVARCIPALVEGASKLRDPRFLEAALAAGGFILRHGDSDGGFPQVVYEGGRVNRYPRWVAGAGDVLRAIELLRPHGLAADLALSRGWLLAGQLPTGAFRVAEGFGSQVSQRPPSGAPDARDLMPVVGWNDKVFRYLAGEVQSPKSQVPGRDEGGPRWHGSPGPCVLEPSVAEIECRWNGRAATYVEDAETVEVRIGKTVCYSWRKCERWASTSSRFKVPRSK